LKRWCVYHAGAYDERAIDGRLSPLHLFRVAMPDSSLSFVSPLPQSKLPSIDVPLLQENYKREESARLALRDQYTKLVREDDELTHKFNQTVNELSLLKDTTSREITNLQSDLLRAQHLNEDFQRRLRDQSH
jgi:hypothetical protein